MSNVAAVTVEAPPPPRIASFAGFIPTLRNAGLVSETWQDAVSLAIGSGVFIAEWNGKELTADDALGLSGTWDNFASKVNVILGDWLMNGMAPRSMGHPQEHRPIGCGDASIWDPCEGAGSKTRGEQALNVSNSPLQVYADDTCSTWAPNLDERKRRATINLERHQSNQIASEFWTGAEAAVAGYTNLSLAGSSTDLNGGTGDVTPSTLALGTLQQALAQGLGDGQSGMIHADRRVIQKWYADGNLWYTRDGDFDYWTGDGFLVDIYGNIFVASGGYPGTAPDGGAAATATRPWVYATGPVVLRLGAIQHVPEKWDGFAPELTEDNDVTIFAERAYTITMDPCAIFAIQLDLCCSDCDEGGS